MNRKYKLALVVFVISLIGMMVITFKLRGEFGIGTEVVVPILGMLLWLHYDAKKERVK